MSKKNLTIRDIAKMACVSHMTVSRVVNNDPRVREETRNKILNLIKKVGFKPDARARAFASKKSNLVGLIVSNISNPFYAALARGVEDKAHDAGYHVVFSSIQNKYAQYEMIVNFMLSAGVDGIIFASARLREPVIKKLINERFPLVLVNRKLKGENFSYVGLDNVRGAYEITQHLINLGYKQIAIITGSSNLSTGIERLKGYQQALKDNGIEFTENYVIQGPYNRTTGYEGAKTFINMKNRPEAIFFGGNDYIAMGVIDAIYELGLRIPEDIALVGFDDTEFASNQRIKLTTVSQRQYEMGNLAVQILIDYIEKKQMDYVHKVILEPRLTIRNSCGVNLRRKG